MLVYILFELDQAIVKISSTHAKSRKRKIWTVVNLLGTQLREYGTPVRKRVQERPNA